MCKRAADELTECTTLFFASTPMCAFIPKYH